VHQQTFLNNFSLLAEAPNFNNEFRTLVLELAFSGNLSSGDGQVWVEKKVEEIASLIQPGFACNKRHQVEDGYVHLRTHNIDVHGKLNFDLIVRIDQKQVDERRAHIRRGDVIFNNTNSQELVGKTCLVNDNYDFAYSNHLTLIRLRDGYEPNYVVRYFNLLWRRGFFANLCNRWIGQAGINTNVLKRLTIPFPPLDEQERIVAETDKLMQLCDEFEAHRQTKHESRVRLNTAVLAPLNKAAALTPDKFELATSRLADNFNMLYSSIQTVDKLRTTILQLAVQGKLVAQDPNDEPASKLLQRIKAEKEKIAKTENGIKKDILDTKGDELFTMPKNWEWVRLDQITNTIHYGYTASANELLTDVRLLRITDIQNGKVEWASVPGCEIEKEKVSGYKLANNDILIARTGGTIGKSYLVENLELVVVFASYLIRAIPNRYLFAKYLKIFLESDLYWKQLYERSMGTGQPNVNATSLKSLAVPLPPVEEQKRIAAKVDQLMSLCDELAGKLRQAEADSEKLMNAAVKHVLDSVRDVSKTAEVFA
jgi:type I restriction enzyme S subunit